MWTELPSKPERKIVAISDSHTFRWGEPPHVYKIKAVEGLLQNGETGVRFASEITVIR